MKKFSKILSLVLAVAMMATLVPTYVFATDTEGAVSDTESNIITLFDFGNPENIADYNFKGKDIAMSAFAADGKSSSLKYTANIVYNAVTKKYDQDNEVVDFYYDATDLSAYADNDATINIRFYSEAEGSKFNFVFLGSENTTKYDIPNDNTDKAVSTYNQAQPAIGYGWQVYTVKLKDAISKFVNYSEDKLLNVRIVANAWNNLNAETGVGGYKDGDELFIDEIYVDTNPDSFYDDIEADETKFLYWKSEMGISGGGAAKKYDAEHGEYTLFSTKNITLTFTQSFTTDTDEFRHYASQFNTADYKWFNLWMYSPYAQDDGLNILLYTNRKQGSSKKEIIDGKEVITGGIYVDEVQLPAYANTYPVHYKLTQVNWEGWKLISIPVSGNNKVIGVDINVAGWNGNYFTNIPSTNNLQFGVDGMWLSNEETSPQAQWEASRVFGDDEAVPFAEDDIVIADFSNPDSVPTSARVSVTADNPFIYDMAARLSFNSATYQNLYDVAVAEIKNDEKMPGTAKANMTIYGSFSNTTDFIDAADGLNENSYLNMWLYNPEPKYTWDGTTPADISIAFGYRNDNNETKLCLLNIIANWSGWKLVSVPVKSINSNLVSKGINYIYFVVNGGWFAVTKSTTAPKVNVAARTEAQLAQGWAAGGSMNVIARKNIVKTDDDDNVVKDENGNVVRVDVDGNNFNYIDVARVWISNGAPEDTAFDASFDDNSALICPEEVSEPVALYSTEENVTKATFKGVIHNADGTVDFFDPAVENGSLALDNLAYGADYGIYAEMYNANGIKLAKDFTLRTEEYHVSEIATSEDGKTSTVKMHGILPEDYADAVLVAAVYSANGDVVKLETVNKADYDAQAGEITASISEIGEGQTVKFLFLSGLGTLKPLADNVRK